MTTIYRLLTEDDTPAFCHKVSEARSRGWVLRGAPSITFDPQRGTVRCAQAVTKEIQGAYHPEMKLGQQ